MAARSGLGNGAAPNPSTDDASESGVREAGTAIAAAILEAADPITGEHSDDVELVVDEICRRLGVNGNLREDILIAARLHDVGKVAIPREILEKPAALDPDEWELVKRHTLTGERILRTVPELGPAAHLVRHSHEHFDGSGYPDGLQGDEIPLGSRIILAADAFHAIRSDRPYREGRSTGTALKEMKRCAGTQFDPSVVEALTDAVNRVRRDRLRRRRLPPRLAILFAMMAIGTGGAVAAERGWIPSPIPGLGPDREASQEAGGGESTSAGGAAAGTPAAGEQGGDGSSGDAASATGRGGSDDASGGGRKAGGRKSADGGRAGSSGEESSSGTQGSAHGQGQGNGGSAGANGNASGAGSAGGGGGGHASGGGSAGASAGGGGGSSSSPGSSGSSPGQSGSSPGQSGSTPGQSGSNPGGGGTPPGQSGSSPGQSGSTPGQSGSTPGQSGSAPGQSGSSPGNSANAPGQAASPGNSGNAPGQGGGGGNPNG